MFGRQHDQDPWFIDITTNGLAEDYVINAVLGFDDDFDGIVDRIDPSDLA